MKRIKRLALSAALIGAAVGVGASPTPTEAAGSGCIAVRMSSEWIVAWCNGGTGYVRAQGLCRSGPSSSYIVNGPWVPVGGSQSGARCPTAYGFVPGTQRYVTSG